MTGNFSAQEVVVGSAADRVAGCLLGGAVGDALGSAVEFDSWSAIAATFGLAGITGPAAGSRFTDDTQMTLFTCEGLIRASVASRNGTAVAPCDTVFAAYQRWLHTQGFSWAASGGRLAGAAAHPDGWLIGHPSLFRREAPGNTCLSALAAGRPGRPEDPVNDSKGCGGATRAAPAGLAHPGDPAAAYRLGAEVAALTHGHPDGWHPAAALAAMVAALAAAAPLADAFVAARDSSSPHMREVMDHAAAVAADGLPSPERIAAELGAGWVGDEAFGIALCCALAADDFASAVTAAVNHSGDSDSTGSICGNLLGAAGGVSVVPASWLGACADVDLVAEVAACFTVELSAAVSSRPDGRPSRQWVERFPPG